MSTSRMAVCSCALMCALLGFAMGADTASANSQRTARATKAQVFSLKKLRFTYASKINFWHHEDRKWTLYLNQLDKPCWEVRRVGPERLCAIARGAVRAYRLKLKIVNEKIARLTKPRLDIGNIGHWICIHKYEGAWTSNTGNGYYGGLQMNWDFMSAYGPPVLGFKTAEAMFAAKGTADKWTPAEQMAVAEYARKSRGYGPWPTTGRMCHLI